MPFARTLGGNLTRRDEAVDAAETIVGRLQTIVVLDLDLVAAVQIDAAIAPRRIAELDVKLEVAERLSGLDICTGMWAAQHAVGQLPLIRLAGHRAPSAQVVRV